MRDSQKPLPSTSVIYLKVRVVPAFLLVVVHDSDSLQSIPLNFKAMFHQYFQLGHRIRKHYLSPHVLLCLLTGKFVPPLNRKNLYSLQYSMLPARRAGIMEMWDAVNSLPSPKRRSVPIIVPVLANGKKLSSNGGRTRGQGKGGSNS